MIASGECVGNREHMEDTHMQVPYLPTKLREIDPNTDLSVFGCFDGHGGPEIAIMLKMYYQKVLQAELDQISDNLENPELLDTNL